MFKVNDKVQADGQDAVVTRVGEGWVKVRINATGFSRCVSTDTWNSTSTFCVVAKSGRA